MAILVIVFGVFDPEQYRQYQYMPKFLATEVERMKALSSEVQLSPTYGLNATKEKECRRWSILLCK